MAIIGIKNLTFGYFDAPENVFEDVSLTLDSNWKLALIGRNGKGKTTLMKILAGELKASGTISANKNFNYFPQFISNPNADPMKIAAEAAGNSEYWRFLQEAGKLDLSKSLLRTPFKLLSGGEQTKVLLAIAFMREDSFPLIDEPTNHLDAESRAAVAEYLFRKKGFILVSHDKTILDCCDHVLAINRKTIELSKGNYSTWLINKANSDNYEIEKNKKLQAEIRRLEEAKQRTAAWSEKTESSKFGEKISGLKPDRGYIGHKSAKMMKRSKAIERHQENAIQEKTALMHNVEKTEKLKIKPLIFPKSLSVRFKDTEIKYGGKAICEKISFTIKNGDRLALSGCNGSGKSSILKLIAGENIDYGGTAEIASGLIISYLPQNLSEYRGKLVDLPSAAKIDSTLFFTMLTKLDIPKSFYSKNLENLSAGQLKKIALATCLAKPAHLYVMDEPINYLDILTASQITETIADTPLTMIFAEHDSSFIDAVATETVEIKPIPRN